MEDKERIAAKLPLGKPMWFRTVWMDPFNVESCCRSEDLEEDKSVLGLWVLDDKTLDGMFRCKTCGTRWGKDRKTGKFWTRRLKR